MSTADQILDQIDGALHDLAVSGDAMRSRPTDEPAVAQVYLAPAGTSPGGEGWQMIRGLSSVEFDQQAIDEPEPTVAATAGTSSYLVIWDELPEYVAHNEAQRARQAQACVAFLDELAQWIAPAFEQAARNAAEGVAQFQQAVEATPQGPRRTDGRPAWQSPYGPARRR